MTQNSNEDLRTNLPENTAGEDINLGSVAGVNFSNPNSPADEMGFAPAAPSGDLGADDYGGGSDIGGDDQRNLGANAPVGSDMADSDLVVRDREALNDATDSSTTNNSTDV